MVDLFKIASRNASSTEHVERMLSSYISGVCEGNLFELVSSDGLATVQAMGLPLYLDNGMLSENHFKERTAVRGEWIAEDPLRAEDVVGPSDRS